MNAFVITAWSTINVLINATLSASLVLPIFSPNALAHNLHIRLTAQHLS